MILSVKTIQRILAASAIHAILIRGSIAVDVAADCCNCSRMSPISINDVVAITAFNVIRAGATDKNVVSLPADEDRGYRVNTCVALGIMTSQRRDQSVIFPLPHTYRRNLN